MLTRLLHRCGLHLGEEKDLMPAAADNPDGFWENLRFVKINDEILNALGGSWDLPPLSEANFEAEQLSPLRHKARLLVESFAGQGPWGWKDPRNCLTIPFWESLLPGLKTVIIVRNPLETAYSMHARNGNSYALGLRLWEIYNRRLLTHTEPHSRIITDYRAFFENPETELRKIAAFLGWPESEIRVAAGLINEKRRHTSFTLEQLIDAGVSPEIVALYRSLTKEATTGSPDSPGEEKPARKSERRPAAPEADRLAGSMSRLNPSIPDGETVRRELALRRGAENEHRDEVTRLEAKINTLTQELTGRSERAAREIGQREGQITEMQASLLHERAELARLREELARSQESSQRNATELAELRAHSANQLEELRAHGANQLDELRARFMQTNQLLQSQSIRLTAFEGRSFSLSERLRRQLLETKRLVRFLEEMARAADRLRRSRRWVIGNLFAAIGAKLRGRPSPGFGHLDRNVDRYQAWRASHPEVDSLDEEIQALRSNADPVVPIPSPAEGDARPLDPSTISPPVPTAPIAFRQHDEVDVSIVIPVFNQLPLTQFCLSSVQQHHDQVRFEVIVVDDCSTDATASEIGKLPGVVYLRNETNAGFIASCNRGAGKARGKYLVFLNNDTEVTEGWLSSLLETFALQPRAGLVGSKLVYPDGRLQEAGGIIWRDGSGWNRGKFQDPDKPEYNYLKEVDYCSAACVMLPKSLFEKVGGFDAKYAPAYYEDTDLAFKIAQAGFKVLYQPLSKIVHYEGATGGTDISAGTKKYQAVNRQTFVSSWAAVLATKAQNGDLETYNALADGQKRILVIDHHLPMIDRDAGSVRMFHILNILHELGHKVTFLPDNIADIPPYGNELRKRGIEVIHHPYCKSVRHYLETHGAALDIVILSRCDFARKHIADVRHCAPQSRIIFDTVDLHYLRTSREAALTGDPELKIKAEEKKLQEYNLMDEADETWVVSRFEQELLQKDRLDKSIEIVPTIVDVPGSNMPFSFRQDFLFIGSFQHAPNVDAVIFFTNEIYPLINERLTGIKFYIIGDKAPPAVIALASENIVVTGLQADVRPYFDSVKLSIAPLRFGAGVKGKINQSMGFGVPVVATPLAVEGMGLTDRREVMIGDRPETFAEALVELYRSESLWNELSERGIEHTRRHYSKEAARALLARLFNAEISSSTCSSNGEGVSGLVSATR